jgi:glycylpeptide N-tetradecanoyltransferase
VSDLVSDADYDKAIDRDKTDDEIQSTPYEIPAGFFWSNINIENEEECKEVYDLLT